MPLLIKQLIDESADNAELSVMNIEPVDWREICDAIPDDCCDPLPVSDEELNLHLVRYVCGKEDVNFPATFKRLIASRAIEPGKEKE